jgi:hypothetical protein
MKINYKQLAEEKSKNKNVVEDGLSFDVFLAACFVKCSSQSYGSKIENRIIKEYGFSKIPKKFGEGDLLSSEKTKFPFFNFGLGKKSELKISYLSADDSWNLIQLRPYENFDFYVFLLINPKSQCQFEWFVINKSDINPNNFSMYAIHGTKESNLENKNIEYKITVPKDGDTYTKLKKLNLIKNV